VVLPLAVLLVQGAVPSLLALHLHPLVVVPVIPVLLPPVVRVLAMRTLRAVLALPVLRSKGQARGDS